MMGLAGIFSSFGMGEAVWFAYLAILLAPFVQEDAAVIGAAAIAAAGMAPVAGVLSAVFIGLIVSDLWKYGLGYLAVKHRWARRLVPQDKLETGRRFLHENLGLTLMGVRFVPGTRIPAYVASGFVRAPFGRFAFWVALSATLYVGVAYGLVRLAGEAIAHGAGPWLAGAVVESALTLFIAQRLRRARQRARERAVPQPATPSADEAVHVARQA